MNTLFIPIRVRLLHLDEVTQVASPSADFSHLPYYDPEAQRIVNNDSPFISENVVNEPFEDDLHPLGSGNHLHFILPTPFTHAHEDGNHLPVPNRWLVQKGNTYWVVESDFLAKKQPTSDQDSITTIIPTGQEIYDDGYEIDAHGNYQPFRYMGRQLEIDQWKASTETGESWKSVLGSPLTAFAYGDAQFSVMYPNCRSVFGFYDRIGTNSDAYQVLGYFDDLADDQGIRDQIQGVIDEIKGDQNLISNNPDSATQTQETNNNQVNAFWEQISGYGWNFGSSDNGDFFAPNADLSTLKKVEDFFKAIDQFVFYSAFADRLGTAPSPAVSLAIGNNGVEALSAFLANETYPSDQTSSDELEDKLEAIQFDYLKSLQNDLSAKFEEARHTKGFKAMPTGTVWDYSYRDMGDGELSESQNDVIRAFESEGNLTALASIITSLNQDQSVYEAGIDSIGEKQQQLFSYWYKYMLCAHPPMMQQESYPKADKVLAMIKDTLIPDLDTLMDKLGKVDISEVESEPNGGVYLPTETGFQVFTAKESLDGITNISGTQAKQLVDELKNAIDERDRLNGLNGTLSSANLEIRLANKPGDRYYQPSEPVVLISGNVVPTANENDQLVDVACSYDDSVMTTLNALIQAYSAGGSFYLKDYSLSQTTQSLNWHPLQMEWEVAFYPLDNPANDGVYNANFITNIYDLPASQPDFVPKSTATPTTDISTYRGFAQLSPYALEYLTKKLEPYGSGGANEGQDDELAAAYDTLQAGNTAVLSQALSGFNEAFIMRKQSLQLAAIADPVAFDDYKQHIELINTYIDGHAGTAPLPHNDFNPIRGGGLNITHLNLIDSFGQKLNIYDYFKDNASTKVYAPRTMDAASHQALLSPRYIQPTRLHARWLSQDSNTIANSATVECSSHSLDSPICGWIVHNILDDSLMIYDSDGILLGSIGLVDNQVAGIPKPEAGAGETFDPIKDVENDHLQKFTNYLLAQTKADFENFLILLTNAQEYTDPDSYAQHPELSLLMGHAVALVRMRLNFEMQGDYATNESWENDKLFSPTSEAFESVEVPIRIGDYQQLNDGVLCFWDDAADPSQDQKGAIHSPMKDYYATHPFSPDPTGFNTYAANSVNMEINQSLDDDAHYLTLLYDPRGKLNITTGVLPVNTLSIPTSLYQPALKNIRVTFLMSPILTPRDTWQLPVPQEVGYQWKWIYLDNTSTAITFPAQATILQSVLETQWDALETGVTGIWDGLVNTGALEEVSAYKSPDPSDNMANVLFNKVTSTDLATLFSADPDGLTQQLMQLLLDYHQGIDDPVTGAQYGPVEIREGWLELIEGAEEG